MKSFTLKLLGFICALSISAFIWIITLQATVLNSDVMKGWLRESGVYNNLVSTIPEVPATQSANPLIDTTLVQQALVKTFQPAYVQQQTERTIDTVYRWLDGKTPELKFSVPVDDKRTTFIEELAAAIKPQLAELPACDAVLLANQAPCRPPTMTLEEFSRTVAAETVTREQVLGEPITEETLAAEQSSTDMQLLNALPATVEWFKMLVIILPILFVLAISIIALIASDKLLAFSRLSRRIFVSTSLTLLGAGILWYLSTNPNILPGFSSIQSSALALLTPVVQKVVGGIAGHLALLSGIATFITAAAWITFKVLSKQHRARLAQQPTTPRFNR